MKRYIIILLMSIVACQWTAAYQIGDIITNTDGSKGVVFYIKPDGSGGYMVALENVAGTLKWGNNTDVPGLANQPSLTGWVGTMESGLPHEYNGYSNTKNLLAYQGANPNYMASNVDFDNGWFVPSNGEWSLLIAAWNFVRPTIMAQGGKTLVEGNYWSSTECTTNDAWSHLIDKSYFGGNYQMVIPKNTNAYVRAIKMFGEPEAKYDTTLTYLWNTGSTEPYITEMVTKTTTYTVTVTSEAGCEATAEHTIYVNSVSGKQIINDSICEGEIYNKYGFVESTTGTYNSSITQNGCTIPVTLNLTVNPVYKDTIKDVICLGESFTKNGFNVTPLLAGDFLQTFHYSTQKGCDSLVTIKLKVLPSYEKIIEDVICQGMPYNKNGFALPVQKDAGIKMDTLHLSTKAGCDSLIVLKLLINKVDTVTVSDQICHNQPYNKYGFSFPPQTSATTLSDMMKLTNQAGCDSVVMINLKVTDKIINVLNTPLCEGDSVFFKGMYRKTTQSVSDTLVSAGGCDSIVTLNLTMHLPKKKEITDSIHRNQPYNKHGFSFPPQHVAKLIEDTLKVPDPSGCDSLIILRLKVLSSMGSCTDTTIVITDEICQGQGYNSYGFVLPEQTEPTVIVRKKYLHSQYGCDSTVVLNLTVNRAYNKETEVFIEKDFPIAINGKLYSEPGVVIHTYPTATGCDSTITTVIKYINGGIGIGDCDPVLPDKFFSPNHDGANDYWTVKNIECYEYNMYIYDRFGKLLKHYPNNFEKWDGMYMDKPLPSTDYWYLIELKDGKTLIGHFTLIR